MHLDFERRQALIDLMAIPEAFDDLRAHHITLPGKPDRYGQVPQLTAVFVQARLLEFQTRSEHAAC